MVLFLLLPLLSFAGVVRHDVTTTDKARFSFSKVCARMVKHEVLLIDPVSGSELDCMGKKVSASAFCEKEMAHDPYYLRGDVDAASKEVVCHSGKKVIFKYQCVKLTDRELCTTEAKSACAVMKEKLARRLDIVHSSFTKNDKGIRELNCYFESLPLSEKTDGRL